MERVNIVVMKRAKLMLAQNINQRGFQDGRSPIQVKKAIGLLEYAIDIEKNIVEINNKIT